jgi:hypothetical protein
MLHAHAPRIGPHFLEDLHEPGSGERNKLWAYLPQWIVAVGLGGIGGIEIDRIRLARSRNAGGDALDEFAVRVHQREAVAEFQVLKGHRLNER